MSRLSTIVAFAVVAVAVAPSLMAAPLQAQPMRYRSLSTRQQQVHGAPEAGIHLRTELTGSFSRELERRVGSPSGTLNTNSNTPGNTASTGVLDKVGSSIQGNKEPVPAPEDPDSDDDLITRIGGGHRGNVRSSTGLLAVPVTTPLEAVGSSLFPNAPALNPQHGGGGQQQHPSMPVKVPSGGGRPAGKVPTIYLEDENAKPVLVDLGKDVQ